MMSSMRTEKTRFTRRCIGEAIIELMQLHPLRQLHISAVVHKAGVSRMTFYKHYVSIQAALEDYLYIIIEEYLQAGEQNETHNTFLSYEHILFSLRFFDRYRDFFLTMKQQGLYAVLVDSVNAFISEHIQISPTISVYTRCSYAGSLLNCFMMWEESGRNASAEDVAMTIHRLFGAE